MVTKSRFHCIWRFFFVQVFLNLLESIRFAAIAWVPIVRWWLNGIFVTPEAYVSTLFSDIYWLKALFQVKCLIRIIDRRTDRQFWWISFSYVLAQCENQSREKELMMLHNTSQYGRDSLQKTDSAIYIHDGRLYLVVLHWPPSRFKKMDISHVMLLK